MIDAKCPVCGAINMCLNLEETDGRYICSVCGNEIQITEYRGKRGTEQICENGNRSNGVVVIAEH